MNSLRTLVPALLLTAFAAAQTPAPPAQAPAAVKEPDYVTTREFKSRMFVVRYHRPQALRDSLRPLGSGFRGAMVEATDGDGVKTISVRDFPENLAAMEEALKRLDVPGQAHHEVELHIHVLFASRQEGPTEAFPEELKDVLGTLKSTLNYRGFTLATSFVQRAADGTYNLRGRGETDPVGKSAKGMVFSWAVNALQVEAPEAGTATLLLHGFELNCGEVDGGGQDLARIRTDLTLKDGEKVVVGTSTVKDKGLIVVVTAKVLK